MELRDTKKWYVPMISKLRYRNENAQNRPQSVSDRMHDRSWALNTLKVINGGKNE